MSITVTSNEKPAAAPTETKPAAAATAGDTSASAPEAKPSEQNASTASETVEPEETETATETEADKAATAAETTAEEGTKGKKKGGFQRRIDKLSARVTAAEQEREFWRQQALKSAPAPETKPAVEVTQETKAADGKPKPEAFETHVAYVEALSGWMADQKLAERDRKTEKERAQAEQAKTANAHSERVTIFKAKTPDFEEMLENLMDVPSSPALQSMIVSAENGPEILYELAKNPEEAKRIAKLPPLAVARELGKIEARLSATSVTKTDPKTITKAPKPIAPLASGGKGAAAKSLDDPTLTQREYETLRKAQMKRSQAV